MSKLKLDFVNGQVVYKDDDGWKFYCNAEDVEKLKQSSFDGVFQFPELQDEIAELSLDEYVEMMGENENE